MYLNFKVVPIIIQNITPQPVSSAAIVEGINREYRLLKALRRNLDSNFIESDDNMMERASVEESL
jgi:hypothetical protein